MSLTEEEKKTIEAYERIFPNRFKMNYHWSDFWEPEFKKFQQLISSGKVIDIGCGLGREARLFSKAGYDYVGIDLSDQAIKINKEVFPDLCFKKMNMHDLDFLDGYFDAFWCAATLFHAPKERLVDVLSEIKRVVKKNGFGFITMQEGEQSEEKVVRDRFFSFYGPEEFKDILEQNGFSVLEYYSDEGNENRPGPTTGKNWLVYFVRIHRT